MATRQEVEIFVKLLKHFGIFEPEDKYKLVCPFHDDKNASLQINVSDAFFFCYAGCGAKGSSLELYKEFYKLKHKSNPEISDLKAQININKIVGKKSDSKIEVGKEFSIPVKKINPKEDIKQARNYYYNLPDSTWYRPSLSDATEDEVRMCRDYMNGRGFSNHALSAFQARASLNRYYPIIFPLLENGVFRGYVMRTFDPEVEDQRKYMYNRGFHRKDVLCGQYKNTDTVVCVEGYLDLVKANQIGIKNVVAFLGWKASEVHLRKLKKAGIKTVICALDNDEAGRKGYRYLKSVSSKYNFSVERVKYPKGIKDMGDLKSHSKQAEIVIKQIKSILDKQKLK